MSDFLKFAYELIAQIIYNLTAWIVAFVQGFLRLFITGWGEYYSIFISYFGEFGFFSKVLSILLVLLLIAIPVLIVILIARRVVLHIQLKADQEDNATLYREIGRLNKQVLDLMDEKNKILALTVGTHSTAATGYVGGDALLDGAAVPATATVGVVTGELDVGDDVISNAAAAAATAAAQARIKSEEEEKNAAHRFPKLSQVDEKYLGYYDPIYDDRISLQALAEGYRLFACSQMHLYYSPEIIRRFIAGMASSKILILEGISGTGKTSLPYSFSRYLGNPATIVSVQPSFRDRSELLGYFNEFSKRFNETEFLRALYEAGYRKDPTFIVLDEMNLARIEYYFAEMLSVLEMPSQDEWVVDLVPTGWPGDPVKLDSGKIHVSPTTWFVGTANNDDSTFTITDKVYDRAMPIELNDRADAFECEPQSPCSVSCEHLEYLFRQAKERYPISEDSILKLRKLDNYLQTRFKLAFGNRIIKQMYDFVPVYVACGGTELGGMDYIIARKVLKKFESLNVMFVRDEIKGLIEYLEKTFGSGVMADSVSYLQRIRNLV